MIHPGTDHHISGEVLKALSVDPLRVEALVVVMETLAGSVYTLLGDTLEGPKGQ